MAPTNGGYSYRRIIILQVRLHTLNVPHPLAQEKYYSHKMVLAALPYSFRTPVFSGMNKVGKFYSVVSNNSPYISIGKGRRLIR